jgi:AcrR family transcriptional regulator
MRISILDSAEIIFAENGFAGARLRDIAVRSDVNQSLINYYFRSKQELFDQVFRRHGALITEEREKLLDALQGRSARPTVADLVAAYLKPQWDMKYSGPRGAAFVKLQARLHAEPEEHAIRLRREVYDRSTKRYLQAFCEALPDIFAQIIFPNQQHDEGCHEHDRQRVGQRRHAAGGDKAKGRDQQKRRAKGQRQP